MRVPWIPILAIAALCVLGIGIAKWTSLERRVNALEAENAKLASQSASGDKVHLLDAAAPALRADSLPPLPPQAPSTPAPAPAATPLPASQPSGTPARNGGYLSRVLSNPEMRNLMATQQAATLRSLYADFVTQAKLKPGDVDRFYKLLTDRQMALMDSSANLVSGGDVDMKSAVAATDAADEALKDLLGPANYALYETFEKTLADRVQVRQFNQQLVAVGIPMTDAQARALVQIMNEERNGLPAIPTGNSQAIGDMDVDQYSQQVAAMNQRVYARAATLLTTAQLAELASFQKTMATTQAAGLKMTQEMLKGE